MLSADHFQSLLADDTVLFGRATIQEAEEISLILNTYARLSRQIINVDK